jgi:hypothetical protein
VPILIVAYSALLRLSGMWPDLSLVRAREPPTSPR